MNEEEIEIGDIEDLIDLQIRQQGVATIKVSDGEVFVFTEDTLRKLLANAAANEERRVVVFIPFQRGN